MGGLESRMVLIAVWSGINSNRYVQESTLLVAVIVIAFNTKALDLITQIINFL